MTPEELTAAKLEVGAILLMEDRLEIKRESYARYHAAFGRECPAGKVPFSYDLPDNKLAWYLVDVDAEVGRVEQSHEHQAL